jgi:hypothetical protein
MSLQCEHRITVVSKLVQKDLALQPSHYQSNEILTTVYKDLATYGQGSMIKNDVTQYSTSGSLKPRKKDYGTLLQPPSHYQFNKIPMASESLATRSQGDMIKDDLTQDPLFLPELVEIMNSFTIVERNIMTSYFCTAMREDERLNITDCMWKTHIEDSTDWILAAYWSNLWGHDFVHPDNAVPGTSHDIDIKELPPRWQDRVKRCTIAIPRNNPGVDPRAMDWIVYFLVTESFINGLQLWESRRDETTPNWSAHSV